MGDTNPPRDDWMTDEHKAAALEGWKANPVAQAMGLTSEPKVPDEVFDNVADAYMLTTGWHRESPGWDNYHKVLLGQAWFRSLVTATYVQAYQRSLQFTELEIDLLLLGLEHVGSGRTAVPAAVNTAAEKLKAAAEKAARAALEG